MSVDMAFSIDALSFIDGKSFASSLCSTTGRKASVCVFDQWRTPLIELLIAYSLAVISDVACARALVGFEIDRGTFSVAPVGRPIPCHSFSDLDLVSHLFEQGYGVRGKPLLNIHDIWHPLIVEARCVHCFLNVHAVVNHAHQDIGNGGNNSSAAGRT